MNTQVIIQRGVLLGVLLGVWTFIMGFTGWYKDPTLALMFWVVVLIQIVVLVATLRKTAAMGQKYGKQVATGLLISLMAGVIVIGNSLLFTTVVFPNYFEELKELQTQLLTQQGMAEQEIRELQSSTAAINTPLFQAFAGFLGTVITGLLLSLVISAFVRSKG